MNKIKPLLFSYLEKIQDTVSSFEDAVSMLNGMRTGEARVKLADSMRSEKDADKIRRKIIDHLEKEQVEPEFKEDFFHLIKRVDLIADWVKEAARELTIMPYLEIPAPIREKLEELISKVEELSKRVVKAITMFIEGKYNEARKLIDEIEVLEEEADEINVTIRGMLLDYADQIKPYSLAILIQEFNTDLEEAADACEDAGDYIRALIVQYSTKS
ncbi:DUF47 family protein [Desulfurococcaceae archaeon MEX13E-LK6-19]|nr:DUF47 family protein [Desulfurococcaceae archaeon MEX13E-LK6-19]